MPPIIVRNEIVGRFDYVLGGSVVLFKLDDLSLRVYLLKLEYKLAARPTESIDHLIIVPDASEFLRLFPE